MPRGWPISSVCWRARGCCACAWHRPLFLPAAPLWRFRFRFWYAFFWRRVCRFSLVCQVPLFQPFRVASSFIFSHTMECPLRRGRNLSVSAQLALMKGTRPQCIFIILIINTRPVFYQINGTAPKVNRTTLFYYAKTTERDSWLQLYIAMESRPHLYITTDHALYPSDRTALACSLLKRQGVAGRYVTKHRVIY